MEWGSPPRPSYGENVLKVGEKCIAPPSSSPGQNLSSSFTPAGYPKVRSYSVQVAATDYDQFAMVFFKKISGKKQYFKTTLYGEFLADS